MVFDEQTDAYVPVFYVLMTSKTQQVHFDGRRPRLTTRFPQVRSHATLKLHFKMQFQPILPGVAINGCLFHWKQAIRHKIIDLKFKENVCKRMMW